VAAPLTAPVVVGVKVTPNVQLAPAPNEAPQVPPPVAKSPLAPMVRLSDPAVWFVRVTVWELVVTPTVSPPKPTLAGDIVNGRTAVPEAFKTSGLTDVPSTSASDPLIVPLVDGLKVAVNVHVPPEAKTPTQPDTE